MISANLGGRNMYLLGGRRVSIGDLIAAELLEVGAELKFVRNQLGTSYEAVVTEEGRIRMPNGQQFASPSPAANAAVGGASSLDGWPAWVVASSGATLATLRQQLLDAVADASKEVDENEASDTEEAVETRAIVDRHERLKGVLVDLEANRSVELTVRELIGWWDAQRRGQMVIESVMVDLENHGLMTVPDFRKVSIDNSIQIVAQPSDVNADADGVSPEVDQVADGDVLDVGLTLGNITDQSGIIFVSPGDSLERATTLMRLNDFSQLAVLSNPRTLSGAVTWASATLALLHHHENATLADATVPASSYSYEHDLVDVFAGLYKTGFVFVRNEERKFKGIVTIGDVAAKYEKTATPFFIIGEIDHLLRSFVSSEWTIDQVIAVCDPNDSRRLSSHDDLTFGDYKRMIEEVSRFDELGWPVDRKEFVKTLDKVREIRNSVAHFDLDPPKADELDLLRNFLKVVRNIYSQTLR